MNNAKLAVAVGTGYLLGRMHKARWALALAGMAAGKRLSANPGVLLGQALESSPQLRQLAGNVRGELAKAGTKAATAAASNRVSALTDQLQRRAEGLRAGIPRRDEDPEKAQDTDAVEETEEETPEEEHPEEERPEGQDQEQEDGGDGDGKRPARSRQSGSRSTASSGRSADRSGGSKAPAKKASPSRTASAKKTASTAPRKAAASAGSARKSAATSAKNAGAARRTTSTRASSARKQG
ncbi:hypothetical protein [Kitasatospora sp. NPDC008115]|uniref:hypothetical protein n=1 Tax=Kitasatospora sp. NPDC008115 TaxID=3364022 RepID=UPI0036E7921C